MWLQLHCVMAACILTLHGLTAERRSFKLVLQGAEGLFDALTWYFPMSFTPPPVNRCALLLQHNLLFQRDCRTVLLTWMRECTKCMCFPRTVQEQHCRCPRHRYAITREALVDALERTFTSTSHFAPHFIPLALDKLSSSVRSALALSFSLIQSVLSMLLILVVDTLHPPGA